MLIRTTKVAIFLALLAAISIDSHPIDSLVSLESPYKPAWFEDPRKQLHTKELRLQMEEIQNKIRQAMGKKRLMFSRLSAA